MPKVTNMPGFKEKVSMPVLMNAIRAGASAEYQMAVPSIGDFDSINTIGNPITSNPKFQNEWLSALMNKVSLSLIKNKSYTNPLARFKKGMLPYGSTVEEIFIDLCQEQSWTAFPANGNEADLFKRNDPSVLARFHQVNREKKYPITIQDVQIKRAFLSWENLDGFISGIIESLYTTDAYAEFEVMKTMIASAIKNNKFYNDIVPNPTNEATAKQVLKKLRAWSNKLGFINRNYNNAGVANHTTLDRQVILMDADVEAELSVEALSGIFQLSQAEIKQRLVLIDNFASEYQTVCAIVDEDWFMIWDTLFEMRSIENPSYLYTNYWLHHHQILSFSDFECAIRLTTDTEAVNAQAMGVTLNP